MDGPLRKVTARVDFKAGNASRSRPASPTKISQSSALSPTLFHPKARVTHNPPLRRLPSSSSLGASRASNVSVPRSRPTSPQTSSRVLQNGGPGSSPKARITARPTSRSAMRPVQVNPGSLEPRQRALTAAPAKLKLPSAEDRPRSGSVILHRTLSTSELGASSPPTLPQPSPLAEPPVVDLGRAHTPPIVLAPIKIKSKLSDFVKSSSTNTGDLASRPLSPPYATSIHPRTRALSITSSLPLNDPPPSAFYPITTASPAANPHRYPSRRAPSPVRRYASPPLSNESHPPKKAPLAAKVEPQSVVPISPHSPPVSALSLSSRSSASKTSVEQITDNHVSSVSSHVSRRSVEWSSQPSPFLPQADGKAQTRRDRSRSKERSPRSLGGDSDAESKSDGSERQLKAEAKTNRKIADLEITNRSLLAINASLETTKNRQAKEIRDLRRKLRESRLILPPRTYQAVATSLDEDEEDDDSDVEQGDDEAFKRVRSLIDGLIESGKHALETQPEGMRASLAKVLNADELRSWRDSGQRTPLRTDYVDKHDADDETIHTHPSHMVVAVPDSGGTSSVESDELVGDSAGSSVPPPITITHSL